MTQDENFHPCPQKKIKRKKKFPIKARKETKEKENFQSKIGRKQKKKFLIKGWKKAKKKEKFPIKDREKTKENIRISYTHLNILEIKNLNRKTHPTLI